MKPYLLFYPTTMKKFNNSMIRDGIWASVANNNTINLFPFRDTAIAIAESFNEDAVVIEIDANKMILDGCVPFKINEYMYIYNYNINPKYFRSQINIHVDDLKKRRLENV